MDGITLTMRRTVETADGPLIVQVSKAITWVEYEHTSPDWAVLALAARQARHELEGEIARLPVT